MEKCLIQQLECPIQPNSLKASSICEAVGFVAKLGMCSSYKNWEGGFYALNNSMDDQKTTHISLLSEANIQKRWLFCLVPSYRMGTYS